MTDSEKVNVLKLKIPRLIFAGLELDDSATIAAYQAVSELSAAGYMVCCAVYGSHLNLAKIFSDLTGRYVPVLDPRSLTDDQMKAELLRSSLGADLQVVISPHSFFESPELGTFKSSPAALAVKARIATYLCVSSCRMGNGVVPALKGFAAFADNLIHAGVVIINSFKSNLITLYPQKQTDYFKSVVKDFFPELDLVILNQDKNLKTLYGLDHYQVFDQKFLNLMKEIREKNPYTNFKAERLYDSARLSELCLVKGFSATPGRLDLKLAVAMDAGFSFLCSNNLVMLSYFGVQIVYFSPLIDKQIPKGVDGLYLPGVKIGEYLNAVKDTAFVSELRAYIDAGKLLYAEGSSSLLFALEKNEPEPDKSSFYLRANLNSEVRNLKVGKGSMFDYNILGGREVPVSYIESEQLVIKESFANKSYLKTNTGHPPFFSPTANSIVTSLYLNFSANPLLAYNLIEAMKGLKGSK